METTNTTTTTNNTSQEEFTMKKLTINTGKIGAVATLIAGLAAAATIDNELKKSSLKKITKFIARHSASVTLSAVTLGIIDYCLDNCNEKVYDLKIEKQELDPIQLQVKKDFEEFEARERRERRK